LRAKFISRLVAILVLMTLPVRAAEFFIDPASQKRLLHRVAVFSDDPDTIHDPRHPQSQTGADRMFAPIGLFSTNHPVPHQYGATTISVHDTGTAFLVSPCLVMTNYHVVFGNRHVEPESGQDFSGTFWVDGRKSHAVPVKYGEYYDYEWRDWVLLQLDSDSAHPCAGEDPNIGWVQLASLSWDDAPSKSLSIAGYPSDKTGISLWRQDTCHLVRALSRGQNWGLWTTDCATRPRASGSPIFFIEGGLLKVVALMHGHMGNVNGDEILPKWDPSRANLAVDMGKIISSDDDILKLIQSDIDRYHQANPAQVVQSDTVQLPQIDDTSGIAPVVSSDLPQLSQPGPAAESSQSMP
jgi:V8-like Glu-specific endopeptidase